MFSGGVSVKEFENGSATPSVEYVRGSDWGGGVGGILYTLRSGSASFTHYNHRGDVTAKSDATGSLTYQSTYEAFGKRTAEIGSTPDREKSNTKPEDLPGYANEGFRFRDLETGVFLTRDQLGFVDGPNLYTYVVQNPWTMFDPLGLFEIYAHDDAPAGHVGITTNGVTYDYGRYATGYSGDWLQAGPGIMKATRGRPKSETSSKTFHSSEFVNSKVLEDRIADHFKSQWEAGQTDIPMDKKSRTEKFKASGNFSLEPSQRYMGNDWGMLGPNCVTETFDNLNEALQAVLDDPGASKELKAEAAKLKGELPNYRAVRPVAVRDKLKERDKKRANAEQSKGVESESKKQIAREEGESPERNEPPRKKEENSDD